MHRLIEGNHPILDVISLPSCQWNCNLLSRLNLLTSVLSHAGKAMLKERGALRALFIFCKCQYFSSTQCRSHLTVFFFPLPLISLLKCKKPVVTLSYFGKRKERWTVVWFPRCLPWVIDQLVPKFILIHLLIYSTTGYWVSIKLRALG